MSLEDRLFSFQAGNYAEAAKRLLDSQKQSWEQCSQGYESLNSVLVRQFEFDGFSIKVQFNPGRLTSSSAKVDPKSIKERKCFLCIENLPDGQKGIHYNSYYLILCNPFPIFPEHFTIPAIIHKPQAITGSFIDLLTLSKDISERYIVFYNGPKCGASAPDHLHFQAGNADFLPLVYEYPALKEKYGKPVFGGKDFEVVYLNDSLRNLIIIESRSPEQAEKTFSALYRELQRISPPGEEPLMNIISLYEKSKWIVIVILREKHRPARYFEEGENNILLSPASVDIGGVCITPLEKDFNKLTKDDLIGIFNEVTLEDNKFSFVAGNLKNSL